MSSPTIFPLQHLDEHTLLQTLVKMPIGIVCRMRQTCSKINRFIVKRKKQMSNRTLDYGNMAGIKLDFTVDEFEILKIYVRQENSHFELNIEQLERRLEGIDIYRIHVLLWSPKTQEDPKNTFKDEKILGQITDILSRFPLAPRNLQMGNIDPEWIVKITNVVNARYVSLERHLGEAEDYLNILRKVREPSRFLISVCDSKVKFDSVKCFDFFTANGYKAAWFHLFLWELYSSKEQKRYPLHLLFSCILEEIPFDKSVLPSPPPNVLLWENKEANAYRSSFRKIEMNSKCAILSEFNNCVCTPTGEKGFTKGYAFDFVDNTHSAVLDSILKEFYIDIEQSLREEFVSCSDERRTEIIEELYQKNLTNLEKNVIRRASRKRIVRTRNDLQRLQAML